MTIYNKTTLKTFFETGDVPTGGDFSNFIDSFVNLAETGVQDIAGALNPTELITARVSAGNGIFTGTMNIGGITSARDVYADTIRSSALSTGTFNTQIVSTSSLSVTTDVSAGGTVYSSAMRSGGFIGTTGIVSAAGTAQGTAAVLTNVVNRGKGIADGSTTGFTPLANRPGLVQYLFNEGVSANLWPPVGGTINGLAANAAFALAASAMVTIVHLTASAMAVK